MFHRLRAAAIGLATVLAFATGTLAQDRVFFGIATGGTGGTYYPLGGMLAQLISNKVTIGGKRLSATAETAGASVANAQLLGRRDIESAFVAADILDAAYKGTGPVRRQAAQEPARAGRAVPGTGAARHRHQVEHPDVPRPEGQERLVRLAGLGPVAAARRPARGRTE